MKFTISATVVGTVVVTLTGISSYYHSNKFEEAIAKCVEIRDLNKDLRELYITILEVESSQKGYLITNDPEFLENYNKNVIEVRTSINNINVEFSRWRETLIKVTNDKLNEINNDIELKKANKDPTISNKHGKLLMDRIRALMTNIIESKEIEFEEARKLARYEYAQSINNLIIGSVIILGLSITSVVTIAFLSRPRRTQYVS